MYPRKQRYVGDPGLISAWRSKLAFHWAIAVEGAIHEEDVYVRADNASERGVPFPASWKSDLGLGDPQPVVDVEALASSAVRRVRGEFRLPEALELTCRLTYTHARTAM